jgi:hypothetical protein
MISSRHNAMAMMRKGSKAIAPPPGIRLADLLGVRAGPPVV